MLDLLSVSIAALVGMPLAYVLGRTKAAGEVAALRGRRRAEAQHYERVRDRLDGFRRWDETDFARLDALAEADRLRAQLALSQAVTTDLGDQLHQVQRWREVLAAICVRCGIALPEDVSTDTSAQVPMGKGERLPDPSASVGGLAEVAGDPAPSGR